MLQRGMFVGGDVREVLKKADLVNGDFRGKDVVCGDDPAASFGCDQRELRIQAGSES